jgi:hypothetical protein
MPSVILSNDLERCEGIVANTDLVAASLTGAPPSEG